MDHPRGTSPARLSALYSALESVTYATKQPPNSVCLLPWKTRNLKWTKENARRQNFAMLFQLSNQPEAYFQSGITLLASGVGVAGELTNSEKHSLHLER